MQLPAIDRINLGHLPTPLEYLPRLSRLLGGPNIYIKRDDCTGIAGGGNKVRKLECLLADAQKQAADTIVTQGAIQSNHVRQTAAACAKLGLSCHVLLEDRTGMGDDEFYANGNVMLSQLLGAEVESYPGGTDMNAMMSRKSHALEECGKKPYIIPGGGSNSIGGLGYVIAADEIVNDARSLNIEIDHIIQATGSAGTQAGLTSGLLYLGHNISVTGISVRFPQAPQHEKVYGLAQEILQRLDAPKEMPSENIIIDDRFIGEGYGIPREDTIDAIKIFARTEGILLDPVYTGKGAAGLIQVIKEGKFDKSDNIVFLHTGGAQSLPGFRPAFDLAAVQRMKA